MSKLLFKEANNQCELNQIHALNHRIFAEEIAQHHRHPSGLLVDRFHEQNRYFIAVRDEAVIGMISANMGPRFSIAKRLPDASLLQKFPKPVEVRLLAIYPNERNGTVLTGLLWQVYAFARENGSSHLLISAITERIAMYRKLGFVSLGPAIADGAASFVPMVLTLNSHVHTHGRRIQLHERHWNRSIIFDKSISLLPGPVCIHPRIAQAFEMAPISHRSEAFTEIYEKARQLLHGLIEEMGVTVFPGAGTLANDVVAANLKAIFSNNEGLILTNGEFGERIVRQAQKAGLFFRQLRFDWGDPWLFELIIDALESRPAWLWAVHLETSTGVLNDIGTLLRFSSAVDCFVALDCVSSLGATSIPAGETLLMASGVSGKALGAYAGLAFVYLGTKCRHMLATKQLCPSFDLLHMHKTRGPVSTVASSALFALVRALEDHYGSREDVINRYQEYLSLGKYTRQELRAIGLNPLAREEFAAPTITTFALPTPSFATECLQAGYQIAHESSYLQSRGWGQIATMGNITKASLSPLFRALRTKHID